MRWTIVTGFARSSCWCHSSFITEVSTSAIQALILCLKTCCWTVCTSWTVNGFINTCKTMSWMSLSYPTWVQNCYYYQVVKVTGVIKISFTIASNRQIEALGSIIFVVSFIFSCHKHSKYLARELNYGNCLSRNFFVDNASVICFLAVALEGDTWEFGVVSSGNVSYII